MRFDGDVLVVAGDKVIDPKVIRQLLAAHAAERSGCDAGHGEAAAQFERGHSAQVGAGEHRGHPGGSGAAAAGGAGQDQRGFSQASGPAPRNGGGHPDGGVRGEDGPGGGGGDLGERRVQSPKSKVQRQEAVPPHPTLSPRRGRRQRRPDPAGV